ncbi:hypothetical protein D3C85_1437270 [compost metagenome]
MQLQHLGHLPLYRQVGVERGHRVLEDHRHAVAADAVELFRAHGQQVLAVVQRFAAGFAVLGQQAHHRQHALALAGAGFADNAQRLAGLQVEADAVDGADQTVGGLELHAEIVYL